MILKWFELSSLLNSVIHKYPYGTTQLSLEQGGKLFLLVSARSTPRGPQVGAPKEPVVNKNFF